MAEGFLSQGEVDALLRGVSDFDDIEQSVTKAAEVVAYNMGAQERIVRGSMPTLEIINERFVRLMRIALFNFMRRAVEVTVGPVQVIKYGTSSSQSGSEHGLEGKTGSFFKGHDFDQVSAGVG